MLQLRYQTHGQAVEEGTSCSVFVPSGPITKSLLMDHFPFEGTFHYRMKIYDNKSGYCWKDILPEDNFIAEEDSRNFQSGTVDIQVLIISAEYSRGDFCQYYKDMETELGSIDTRIPAQNAVESANRERTTQQTKYNKPSESGANKAHGMNLDKLAKGATNIAGGMWSTLVSTASSIHHSLKSSAPLTDEADEQLAHLADKLGSAFSDDDAAHLAALQRLWCVLFPGLPFERHSNTWKEAGFQSNDPIKDLKQSGLLALEAMIYLGSVREERTHIMLASQKANAAINYPFAIVGINLTLLLASIISLKDHRYLSTQAPYWKFFETPNAFYEVRYRTLTPLLLPCTEYHNNSVAVYSMFLAFGPLVESSKS
jgi:hypothetical protein